ncbi:MAG: hypothetical protein IJI71_07830, partial [Clostridia bacterium]|nr:hypothetical protein [Clostridia bacterium]
MKKTSGNRYSHGLPWFALRRIVALVLALLMLAPANIVSVFAEGAQSGGKTPVCGLEAHAHSDACYEEKLACGETERDPVTQTRRVYVGNLKAHTHTKACYSHGKLTCGTVENAYFHEHNQYCYDDNGKLVCGLKEKRNDHEHTDKCYEKVKVLTCDKKESDGHKHSKACYEKQLTCTEDHKHGKKCYEKVLVCGKKEGEGAHKHGKKCYETRRGELTCQKGEYRIVDGQKLRVQTLKSSKKDWSTEQVVVDEGHKHTEACYEKVLSCGKEEHEHSEACYKVDQKPEESGEAEDEAQPEEETHEEVKAETEEQPEEKTEEQPAEETEEQPEEETEEQPAEETEEQPEETTEEQPEETTEEQPAEETEEQPEET